MIIPEGALPGQDLEIPVPRPEQIQARDVSCQPLRCRFFDFLIRFLFGDLI